MRFVKLALTAAIIAGAVVAIRYVSWTPVRCNDVALNVSRRMQQMMTWSDRTGIVVATRENIARLEPCRGRVPWNINLHLLVAANYAARDMHEDAIRVYEEALQYDRRPEIYFNLGLEMLKAGRVDEAVAQLTTACKIRTDFVDEIPDHDTQNRVVAAMGPE
jgi:tetratricopeptide (TPR) repeat protein